MIALFSRRDLSKGNHDVHANLPLSALATHLFFRTTISEATTCLPIMSGSKVDLRLDHAVRTYSSAE